MEFKSTTVAPGVRRQESDWGTSLSGAKDALIASGLVKGDWFIEDGLVDHRGRTQRTKKQMVDGRYIETTIRAKGPAQAFISFTDEERQESNKRCQAEVEAAAARARFKYAAERADLELRVLPSSHEDFREYILCGFRVSLEQLHRKCKEGVGGYRLAPEALEEFEEAAEELLAAVMEGRTLFNADSRARREAEIRKGLAEQDPTFQGFMTSVVKIDAEVQ